MYQPEPLNWIAGDDSSFITGPAPHDGQTLTGSSENFWIRSNWWAQASQRYS